MKLKAIFVYIGISGQLGTQEATPAEGGKHFWLKRPQAAAVPALPSLKESTNLNRTDCHPKTLPSLVLYSLRDFLWLRAWHSPQRSGLCPAWNRIGSQVHVPGQKAGWETEQASPTDVIKPILHSAIEIRSLLFC